VDQDMLLSQAMLLLRDAEVRISGGTLEELSLTLPDSSTREVRVKLAQLPPTPSKLAVILERQVRTLLVTSRPSKAVADAAERNLVDLITIAPATVVIGGVRLLEPRGPEAPARSHGRTPWGRWAMLRALALAPGPLTQRELAEAAGISQPAVNKNLKSVLTFVHRDLQGWTAQDRDTLLTWWTANYPGPRGASTYWYSLKTPMQQAEDAAAFAEEMGAAPLVSGDAAADIYAPWRLPDAVHLYLRQAVDFTDAGFTPATREEATLISTIPEDPTLWPTAALSHREGLPLADPLVTLRDVMDGVGADSPDAAEHLRAAILTGAAR
jgi:hypothetical protein